LTENGFKVKTVDIAVGIFLILAIVAIGYAIIAGNSGLGGLPKTGNLIVHFIDVGQGDSVLILSGDKTMLVDGGRLVAGPKLASYLKSQGITQIDVMVSTHPHADHIGGLLTVLKQFPVKHVVDSGIVHPTQTYESYLTLIDQLNIPYTVGEAGQTIDLDPNVQVEVLAPPASHNDGGVNENSIVLKVTYGSVSFLLMADAGIPEENQILASGYDIRSDVYKVPHHGSPYSASSSFVAKVKPEVSIIEVGPNLYGHPAPGALAVLEDVGSTIYRTDLNGNVVVTTDGRSFTVMPQYETAGTGKLICAPAFAGMRCSA
jgi:competence protein ComEC